MSKESAKIDKALLNGSSRQRSGDVAELECEWQVYFFPLAGFPSPLAECGSSAIIKRVKSSGFNDDGFCDDTCFEIERESNYAASLVKMPSFFVRVRGVHAFQPI